MRLHGFFRSSASYRVRLALGLKGLDFELTPYVLRRGDQRSEGYLNINPQGLLPALETDNGVVLTQSLAICEYLDELYPEPPLLPAEPVARAKVRAFALAIVSDIHPVQNLKILKRLEEFGLDDERINQWVRITIGEGLDACEALISNDNGPFCFGDRPTLADICLIPQLFNARRYDAMRDWPRLLEAEAASKALPAFAAALPELQSDATP